jgi:hypothetical protein
MKETPETRLIVLEQARKTSDRLIETLQQDIKEIKDKLLGRPSWPVTIIITILTAVCVGLLSHR